MDKVDMEKLHRDLFESGQFYHENYDVTTFEFTGMSPQILHDEEKDCICRFCGKKFPEVTFKKKAHAISRFLGNTVWMRHNECDQCNEYVFSPMEGDLAKYLQLSLNVSRINGRNGIPTIKNEMTGFRMECPKNGNMHIICPQSDMIIDEVNKKITINPYFNVQKYVPINVVKAFVKMICSVISKEDFIKCKNTVRWLMSNDNIITRFPILHTFVPGPNPFGHGRLMVLKRNTSIISPYIWGIFEYGNFRYQIMLPFCDEDNFWQKSGVENNFKCSFYPLSTDVRFHEIYGNPIFYIKDMSGCEGITEKCNSINFSFSKLEKIPSVDDMVTQRNSLSDMESSPLSLLPLYRISSDIVAVVDGQEKNSTVLYGSYSNDNHSFELTSNEVPIHIMITCDEKHTKRFSVNFDFNLWRTKDIRDSSGISSIKDLLKASQVICKIVFDGIENNPLELPFPMDLLANIQKEISPFILYHDAVSILNIPSTYNDFIEDFNKIDFYVLRDFVVLYKKHNFPIEKVSMYCSSIITKYRDNPITFSVRNSFVLRKRNVIFQTEFKFTKFKIVEKEEQGEESMVKIESVQPVIVNFIDYMVENIK